MGQHEIPQRLRIAQPRAVAHHHPGMGSQHRDMIGRGLGVRRAHPDIHQRDPGPTRALEVIGRHLRQPLGHGQGPVRCGDLCIVGADKGGVAACRIGQRAAGEGLEFRDVELIVRKQHVILEMRRIGRGVMRQPRQ